MQTNKRESMSQLVKIRKDKNDQTAGKLGKPVQVTLIVEPCTMMLLFAGPVIVAFSAPGTAAERDRDREIERERERERERRRERARESVRVSEIRNSIGTTTTNY
jgi:hypothetical protein